MKTLYNKKGAAGPAMQALLWIIIGAIVLFGVYFFLAKSGIVQWGEDTIPEYKEPVLVNYDPGRSQLQDRDELARLINLRDTSKLNEVVGGLDNFVYNYGRSPDLNSAKSSFVFLIKKAINNNDLIWTEKLLDYYKKLYGNDQNYPSYPSELTEAEKAKIESWIENSISASDYQKFRTWMDWHKKLFNNYPDASSFNEVLKDKYLSLLSDVAKTGSNDKITELSFLIDEYKKYYPGTKFNDASSDHSKISAQLGAAIGKKMDEILDPNQLDLNNADRAGINVNQLLFKISDELVGDGFNAYKGVINSKLETALMTIRTRGDRAAQYDKLVRGFFKYMSDFETRGGYSPEVQALRMGGFARSDTVGMPEIIMANTGAPIITYHHDNSGNLVAGAGGEHVTVQIRGDITSLNLNFQHAFENYEVWYNGGTKITNYKIWSTAQQASKIGASGGKNENYQDVRVNFPFTLRSGTNAFVDIFFFDEKRDGNNVYRIYLFRE